MTREEAITIIDNLRLIGCGRNQHENDLKINVALDMAIEALTRPHSEWIFNPKDAIDLMFIKPKCSECGFESSDGGSFCSNCGARTK